MSRRLLRLCGCLLLLLALGTHPTSFAQTTTAPDGGSLPTPGPSTTPTSTAIPTPTSTPAPTPTFTPPQETCTVQTAVWTDDQWGGHYFIYWPANWETMSTETWHLKGNFLGARYRVLSRQGNDNVYLWVGIGSNFQQINNPVSQGDAWQTIGLNTEKILFGTDAFLGAQTFTLEFCTTNPPVQQTGPLGHSCYTTHAVAEMDQWQGHYIATWREGWPIDPQNRRLLLGNYQNATYRITNYQGVDNEPVRLWLQTSTDGTFKSVDIRDSAWRTITDMTKSITFVAHIPMGGRAFDLEICFAYYDAEVQKYDITRTPEGNHFAKEAFKMWGASGIDTSRMKIEEYQVITTEVPTGALSDIQDSLVKPKTLIRRTSYKYVSETPIGGDGEHTTLDVLAIVGDAYTIAFPADGFPSSDNNSPAYDVCTRRVATGYGITNQCIFIRKQAFPEQNAIKYIAEHWVNGRYLGDFTLTNVDGRSHLKDGLDTTSDVTMGMFTPNSDSQDTGDCLKGSFSVPIAGSMGNGNNSFSIGIEPSIDWEMCPSYRVDSATYSKGLALKWQKPAAGGTTNPTKAVGYGYGATLNNAYIHQSSQNIVSFDFNGSISLRAIRFSN